MANYFRNVQKKRKLFNKRERGLMHAINHGFGQEKRHQAAEKLRIAKLNFFKAEFSDKSLKSYVPGDKEKEWQKISVDEIIKKYSTRQNDTLQRIKTI